MIGAILGACTAGRMTLIRAYRKTRSSAALTLASRSCSTTGTPPGGCSVASRTHLTAGEERLQASLSVVARWRPAGTGNKGWVAALRHADTPGTNETVRTDQAPHTPLPWT
jgi:hypothetical protein